MGCVMRFKTLGVAMLAAGFALSALAMSALAQPGPGPAPASARPVVTTALPTAPASGAHALTHDDLEAWLDGYVPYALARGDVAGAVVVVVKDGQVVLQKGYGYADVATRKPVDPETTLFRPGSVSKLFTWTALMQQVEQGKLDLDRDINDYLDFKIPAYQGQPITARNLMTHTPGFEESVKELITLKANGSPSLEAHLKRWTPARIFPPGKVPAYSNYGAALAGYLVQRLSGQSFDDYVDQHIFQVLGMTHATFRQPLPDALKPSMATGYKVASSPGEPFEYVNLAPAGSSAISGGDMARFMIAHLQNGTYEGRQILKPETAKMMHDTPYTAVSPSLHRMLLGFYEIDRNGHRVFGHGGDTRFFHSYLQLFPDDNIGLFISVNSAGKEGAAGPIRTALFNGFTDRYLPGPAPSGQVDPAQALKDAAAIAGTYDDSRRMQTSFMSLLNLLGGVKVTTDGKGRISTPLIRDLNGQPQTYEEIAPFVWRQVGGKERLAAKVEDGKVAMWSEDELSPFMVFQPTPAYRHPGWLLPLLYLSLAALVLTAVLWPVTALVRRRYGASFALEGRAATSYRLVRVAALASAAVMITWFFTITNMLQTFGVTAAMDPWITVLHLLSIVAFPLAALAALWNVVAVWGARRGWRGAFARGWSLVLAVSTLTLLWVALVFHLIGFTLNY